MSHPADDIRARRAASNAAIASRDVTAVAAIMTEDVTVAVAGGPVLRSREANRRAFAEQMAESGFGGYVRTPAEITVAPDGRTATERGTWAGLWRVGLRTERTGGSYVATWRLAGGEWLIAEERFVSPAR